MTREEAIEVYNGLINTKIKEAFEFFAPELAESEDERIRKGLIEALKASKTVGELKFIFSEPTRDECIAYLEKQKEQKTYEPHNWPADKDNLTQEQKPAEWSEKHIANVFEKVGLAKIVREQGNDALTNAVQSAMIELSKTKPAEWSKEDSKMLDKAIELTTESGWDRDKEKCLSWLKSLRPSWKPSEEQICSLGTVVKGYNERTVGSVGYNLKELYEQLKAL